MLDDPLFMFCNLFPYILYCTFHFFVLLSFFVLLQYSTVQCCTVHNAVPCMIQYRTVQYNSTVQDNTVHQ